MLGLAAIATLCRASARVPRDRDLQGADRGRVHHRRGGGGPVSPDDITTLAAIEDRDRAAVDEADRLGEAQVGPEQPSYGDCGARGTGNRVGRDQSLGVTMESSVNRCSPTLGRAGQSGGAGQRTHSTLQHLDMSTERSVILVRSVDLLDDAAKRVLAIAEEEARQMRHNWIGTEHLLIALLRAPGLAIRVLHELGVTMEQARAGVFKAVPPTETDVTEVNVTPRVKTLLGKAITLAAPVSDKVRPQHLLIALVADPDGIGSQVLTQLGVTKEKCARPSTVESRLALRLPHLVRAPSR